MSLHHADLSETDNSAMQCLEWDKQRSIEEVHFEGVAVVFVPFKGWRSKVTSALVHAPTRTTLIISDQGETVLPDTLSR